VSTSAAISVAIRTGSYAGVLLMLVLHSTELAAGTSSRSSARAGSVYADAVVEEIAAFQPGTSAAQWMTRHPGDLIEKATPPQEVRDWGTRFKRGHWCLRAKSAGSIASGLLREVYFYPPGMPARAGLPDGADPNALAMNACTAHALSLEVEESSAGGSGSAAAAIEDALTRAYGVPRREPISPYFLHEPSGWKGGVLMVVAGYDLPPPHNREIVLAIDAAAQADIENSTFADTARSQYQYDLRIINEAMKLVPVDDTLKHTVLTSAGMQYRPNGNSAPNPQGAWPQYLGVLRQWLSATAHLGRTQRAAALLVADRLVSMQGLLPGDASFPAGQRKPWIKSRNDVELEKLGAKIGYSELAGGYFYFHNWAIQAWRLDGHGPAGTLAFLVLMGRGFDPSPGMCDGGAEQFRTVIAEGSKFLQGSTDPAANAQVHFMIGDAYADIVALGTDGSQSPDNELPPPDQYRAGADKARAAAIEQYRAGLRLDRSSVEARSAWEKAWRLIAGLAPEQIRYYCIYD